MRVTETSIIRRGTIATDVPARTFIRGMGEVMLSLRVDTALIETWRTQGVTHASFLKNHGLNAEGFFEPPAVENDALGHLDAFAVESKDGRSELAVDFNFHLAYLLDKPVLEAVARTSPVIPTSVGFSFDPATDIELMGTGVHENGLPLVRAKFWRMAEGSITTVGLDQATHIRTATGSPVSRAEFDEVLAQIAKLIVVEPAPRTTAAPETQDEENEMTDEEIQELVDKAAAAGAKRALEEKRAAPIQSDAEAGEDGEPDARSDDPGESDPWEEVRSIAVEHEIASTAIEDMLGKAGGNIGAFRALVKSAVAAKQETATPAAIEQTSTASERSLEIFIAATLARALPDDADRAAWAVKAEKLDPRWGKRNLEATCRDILASQPGYDIADVYEMTPGQLLETTAHRTKGMADRAERGTIKENGAVYFRTAQGGLVPADLPSAYTRIVDLSVQIGYERHVIPFERVAQRETTTDFEKSEIVDVSVALEFRPLETSEGFMQAEMREQRSTFSSREFGHQLPFTIEALIRAPDRMLVGVPAELGQLYGSGKNRIFSAAVTASGNFTGNQIIAGSPLDYSKDIQLAVERAWLADPVRAASGDEFGNEGGKTTVLQPTAILWGSTAWHEWIERTREVVAGMALDREKANVHDAIARLRANSHLALEVPFNVGVAWPGPESQHSPVRFGGVQGRDGIRVLQVSRGAETGERDSVTHLITTTFGADTLESRRRNMYQFTDNALTNPAT